MQDTLLSLLLLLPLLSAAICLLLLRNVGRGKLASLIATISSISTLLISLILLPSASKLTMGSAFSVGFSWLEYGALNLRLDFALDRLASSMMVIVTLIGSLVHLFSLVYMKDDEGRGRYFGCLSLFLFSMTGIVLAENLLVMFIFWELVGLSSYLLIGHWFFKPSAAAASTKAFLANRIGDLGFLAGILGLWALFGTMNFAELGGLAKGSLESFSPTASSLISASISLILIGIFCGAVGKSAQFPLHVWLPDAMEGPTPVSALIHAATMVAAGVFMLVRVSGLLLFDAQLDSGFAAQTITWIGAITALLAALMATQQDDIKRILAYSTLSQLGYMVMAVGLLAPEAGFFHLFTHAWFKALLFLGAGAIIYACHHEQDIWKMGGLLKRMKITSAAFLTGTAALIAVPWVTSGFWSKEAIFLAAMDHGKPTLFFWIAVLVALLTAFYMTRLVCVVFFGKARSEHAKHAQEVPPLMFVPLLVLAALSVVAGWGWFSGTGIPALFNVPAEGWVFGIEPEKHKGKSLAITLSIGSLIVGAAAAALLYLKAEKDPLRGALQIFRDKLYFDELYDFGKTLFVDRLAAGIAWVDRVLIGQLLIGGSAKITRIIGTGAAALQNGNLAAYAILLIFGLVGVLFFTVFLD